MKETDSQQSDYCERCQHSTSNRKLHNCRYVFLACADEAYRNGDHHKVAEIVERARVQGIDLNDAACL